jgi:penicillin-binding protein 1A
MSSEQPPPPGPRLPRLPQLSPFAIRLVLIVVAIGGMAAAFALAIIPAAKSLGTAAQTFDKVVGCKGTEDIEFPRFPERSTIYASNGTVLANIFLGENRSIVPLSGVDQAARKAVIGIEDYQFYQHGAIDLKAILRAAIDNFRAGHVTQGGSTITQQLVKNVTGHRQDTFRRKLHEMCLAIAAERRYSKNQILDLYLNEVYFGHGLYGIDTAAQSYFGVHASQLTMRQAALLAGVIAAPGSFDPVVHPKAAVARRNQVLGRLAQIGWIGQAKARRLEATSLGVLKSAGQTSNPTNPFFVQYITGQILRDANGEYKALGTTYQERKHTLFQGGLKITTTLDPRLESEALHVVRTHLPKPTDPQAAVSTVEVGTGAIRALVSGRNFARSHQDLVTGLNGTAGRQAGSAFKPFTLVAAFREGIPPGKVYDSKQPIFLPQCNSWKVQNAEPGTGGYVNLWTATQDSINVVFAQLARDVGPPNIARAAHDMGITSSLPDAPQDCSITLGTGSVSPLEMSVAYATLADNGMYCPAYAVERIVGPGGRTIYRHKPKIACKQVVDPNIAHLVTAMLQKVVCCGTGTLANIGRPQAGKTGTNTEYKDAWFVGYVPQYSTAVWVGYPQGEIPMYNVEGVSPAFGGTVAAPIWHDYMLQLVQNLPALNFPPPPPEKSGQVPNVVGMLWAKASKTLAQANFTPIRKNVPSPQPKGTVVAQTPRAGAKAVLGTGVTLSVSTGQPAKGLKVPNVVGMTQHDAQRTLQKAGFVVSVVEVATTDPKQDGIVVDQNPKAGHKADQGSTVTISVGHYQKPAHKHP